ncbi:aminobenzoyl-glutamate utilization protein B [Celerinatantimonas diazotrophica]|uniref:Aminobenzoyl-glutamate utilization protein B n=2 Tax=Celerinatantimonas diazotrophica TaxID=412034 RepID=A0A4R1J840_9GAMM|nr:aminobenzoyl-glutamate utilization protein B [Celerinatantimonas diazotrophica]CAG9295437.1 p-aminobenzoyl-glutamate hydrolase subunit B [Celerinatantimonas diazotrophica]
MSGVNNDTIYHCLWQRIDAHADSLTQLSQDIWGFAETRFEEHQSCAAIKDFLAAQGFTITAPVANLDTAFIATYGEGYPHVGFLGEYDALPGLSQQAHETHPLCIEKGGNGHGCGHHLLGVASVAAALALKQEMEQHQLPGRVTFYGCPAEEGGSGKTFMVRDGIFADTDIAITWHPQTFMGIFNTPSLANIQAEFHFKGKAAHAAAAPHLGRSALDAVELMNVAANYLREHVPSDSRIHYAITESGGSAPNVVQAQASVRYLVRSPRVRDVQGIYERIQQIAQGAALMSGTSVEVDFIKACSSYQPNRYLEQLMSQHIECLGIPQYTPDEKGYMAKMQQTLSQEDIRANIDQLLVANRSLDPSTLEYLYDSPVMDTPLPYQPCYEVLYGSTDVGDVSWVVPTVQCCAPSYAFGTPLHTWQAVSQGNSSVGFKGLFSAAKVMAATGLEVLLCPEHVTRAQQELMAELKRHPYTCPIPQDVVPRA